jgi:hypothetical protein
MANSLLPWRQLLPNWPDAWRERWGLRANELEESGLGWVEAERQAWDETLTVKNESKTVPTVISKQVRPKAKPKPRKPERTLFKESA